MRKILAVCLIGSALTVGLSSPASADEAPGVASVCTIPGTETPCPQSPTVVCYMPGTTTPCTPEPTCDAPGQPSCPAPGVSASISSVSKYHGHLKRHRHRLHSHHIRH